METPLKQQLFQKHAKQLVESLYTSDDRSSFYDELKKLDPGMINAAPGQWLGELFCAELALKCMSWQVLTSEYDLKEDGISKALLRTVMDSFSSPQSVDAAVKFSEYFQATGFEEHEGASVAVAARFWKRIRGEEEIHTQTFRRLVEYFEALRVEFENQFVEFITEATFPKHNE